MATFILQFPVKKKKKKQGRNDYTPRERSSGGIQARIQKIFPGGVQP